MKPSHGPEAVHHTVIFSALGLMSDTQVRLALVSLGVPLPAEGCERGERPTGSWFACGLRSDGVVELWRATRGGVLQRQLKEAAIPYRLRDCAG